MSATVRFWKCREGFYLCLFVANFLLPRVVLRSMLRLSRMRIAVHLFCATALALAGFSKNIHAFFGKNWLILLLFIFLTTFGPFAVWMAFSLIMMFFYLATLVIFSALISVQSRQSVWKNLIFMPFQQISVVIISIMAAYRQFTGRLSWKGRKI